MKRAIIAGQLLDGTDHPPLPDPVLILSEGRIERVLSRSAWEPAADEDFDVLEYPGATILPGMIDGHVHLALSAANTTEEVLAEYLESDPIRLVAMATENARRCLVGGVTTVRDCGGPGTLTQSIRDAVDAKVLIGPRILSSGMPITTTAGHCHFFGLRADSVLEVRRAVRQLVQERADFIKVMGTGGRMTPGSNVLQPQYSLEELQAIVQEARRLGRRVAAHVLCVDGIRRCVEAGVDTLEHCLWLDELGNLEPDEEILEEIVQRGTSVSLTNVGLMRDAVLAHRNDPDGSPVDRVWRERFQVDGQMYRRGLKVFITSDAGVARCRFDEFYLSLVVAVDWWGLTPKEAIEAVTSRAAEALGIEEHVGVLEPGKVADVLVVDADPLKDIMNLGRVAAVFRDGRLLSRHGAVLPAAPDERGARRATTARPRALF